MLLLITQGKKRYKAGGVAIGRRGERYKVGDWFIPPYNSLSATYNSLSAIR